jgi:DNA-directed RNA polymerase specialized sigma24 family protein
MKREKQPQQKQKQKQKLPREVLQLVEWMLREYPRKEEELDVLDRFISERCHARMTDAAPGGTPQIPASIQERILEEKERSSRYRWLRGFIDRVEDSLATLSPIESSFVECYYWEDMTAETAAKEIARDLRTVFRIRNRALSKLAFTIVPELVYHN